MLEKLNFFKKLQDVKKNLESAQREKWENAIQVCRDNHRKENEYSGLETVTERKSLLKEFMYYPELFARRKQGEYKIGDLFPNPDFRIVGIVTNPENKYDNVIFVVKNK